MSPRYKKYEVSLNSLEVSLLILIKSNLLLILNYSKINYVCELI